MCSAHRPNHTSVSSSTWSCRSSRGRGGGGGGGGGGWGGRRGVGVLPWIDINRPAHRAARIGGLTLIATIVVLLSVTGYRAYHFTESTEFCGMVCHQVMKPEHTAHRYSPHARVACTQCHVGPGAGWFVRSKLSGLYEVYAVTTNRSQRPIPTPAQNLRP